MYIGPMSVAMATKLRCRRRISVHHIVRSESIDHYYQRNMEIERSASTVDRREYPSSYKRQFQDWQLYRMAATYRYHNTKMFAWYQLAPMRYGYTCLPAELVPHQWQHSAHRYLSGQLDACSK